MSLTEYRRKRDFKVTSEPRGRRVKRNTTLLFVVQKHAASHLHYDFRLELNGVLLSWAVPKGPSLDPEQKRLAMHVEDHPIEYGDFEGVIPEGEYGGGTVLLWDRGSWEPESDAKKAYREGALKFTLHGEKLKGRWMLVRKGGRRSGSEERHWFLFKERDEYSNPGFDITEDNPLSVQTGRDLEEIAQAADRVWGKNGEVTSKARKPGKRTRSTPSSNGNVLVNAKGRKKPLGRPRSGVHRPSKIGVKKSSAPANLKVELATLVDDAPEGKQWIHEIKFDGYRMLCRIESKRTRFISRNGKDWTAKFPALKEAASDLGVKTAILDGEVVIQDDDGRTSFQALQNAFQERGNPPFLYYVFDILFFDDYDVRDAPIEERKGLLKELLPDDSDHPFKYSDHLIGNGAKIFAEASRLHLEGIISKKLGSPYIAGRGFDWLKTKCSLQEEFVIGGFTKPEGSRTHFGALLLGYYDDDGDLNYAGRVGTGFDDRTLASLHTKFKPLIQSTSSFKNLSGTTGQARGVTWLKPSLVAQVRFSNWTGDRQLRHPSYLGLREDKLAKSVVRDDPISPKTVASSTEAKKKAKTKRPSQNGTLHIPKAASKSSGGGVQIAGVTLSHPDKVLYPEDGLKKLDLAKYYEKVASWMLPHVENRLLSLVRCPEGSAKKCFFQKHPGQGLSDHLRRFPVQEKGEVEDYLALYDLPGIISLVQMSVLEIHIWGSQADRYEKPDRLIFDLDPDPAVKWPEVIAAAREVKLLLEHFDLTSFVKTTGGKGLHVVVPIQRRVGWDEAKEFCKAVADFMVRAAPDRYIAKMSKAARKGKIFVDYLRNDEGSTAIAPFSTRAKPGATVSVPITWEELKPKLTSNYFDIENLPSRLNWLKKDPWAGIESVKQSIKASMLKTLTQR
jgi:bifunctional non-homologous end joining protein LigD